MEKAIIRMLSNKDFARRLYEYPLIANLISKSEETRPKGTSTFLYPARKIRSNDV